MKVEKLTWEAALEIGRECPWMLVHALSGVALGRSGEIAPAEELLDAAARAEERANEAEAELERLQMEGNGTAKPEKPVGIVLNEAVNVFLASCDMMTFDPVSLQRDVFAVKHGLQNLQEWIDRMQAALEMPVITEAGVV